MSSHPLKATPIEIECGVVYCWECRLFDKCPIQEEKDKNKGNPFKKIIGCLQGKRENRNGQ